MPEAQRGSGDTTGNRRSRKRLRMTSRPQLRAVGRAATALAAAGALALVIAGAAAAQSQPQPLPGLVVTVPPGPAAEPPAAVQTQPLPPPKAPAAAPAQPPRRSAKASPEAAPAKASATPGEGGRGIQSIAVLVNDEPITGFEIEQRARLMALQANLGERATEAMKRLVSSEATTQRWRKIVEETVQQNQGKTRDQVLAILEQKKTVLGAQLREQALASAKASVLPGLKKQAQEELIDERLKLQEAKRLNVVVDDKEVDDLVKGLADRNKMTEAQFGQHIKGLGSDLSTMKSRFRATLVWREVVRRRFGNQVSVNERDIERFVSKGPKGEDQVELHVQRIVIPLPAKIEQKAVAQRLDEADAMRRDFKGCANMRQLAARVSGARFEDLGTRRASAIPEPTRSILLSAEQGEIVPPSTSAAGIEVYAVCQRKVVTADEGKRTEVASELRQQEFELLAKRHLKDLRQDAHIELR